MKEILYVICVLIIVIVLLQSNKASDASQIITGGNAMRRGKSKERGAEKVVTELTYILGAAFIILSMILSV